MNSNNDIDSDWAWGVIILCGILTLVGLFGFMLYILKSIF